MPGGLLQLVAFGAQDAYIIGNPQITFWKGLYKRHTNFAMEPFRVNFTGVPSWGTKQNAVLGRHADLVYSTYLQVVLPPSTSTKTYTYNNDANSLGYNLLKYIELQIGEQSVDKQYSEWLYLWSRLSSGADAYSKVVNMVGGNSNGNYNTLGYPYIATMPQVNECAIGGRPEMPQVLYIPLNFFYTRNPGSALPLIALQYHDVRVNIEWNPVQFVAGNVGTLELSPNPLSAALYVDYIYLDTEERRRFAQKEHEYLIELVQYNEDKGVTSGSSRIDLTFNHPVKELVWVVQPTYYTNCSLLNSYLQTAYPPGGGIIVPVGAARLKPFTYNLPAVYEQKIQLNGQDRVDMRYGDYFNRVQHYQHHSSPSLLSSIVGQTQPGIYMYSFALKPEENQPSGTCNFSRIDNAHIVMNMSGNVTVDADNTWDVRVYAVNYNILRIMSGMAGLAYSN